MTTEYKETVERRYFTITGVKANEELIENLISSGESETFLQKAMYGGEISSAFRTPCTPSFS